MPSKVLVTGLVASLLVAGACSSGSGTSATASSATPGASATATGNATTQQTTAAANAFLATLSAEQKDTVSFDWTDTAQKQRWSNFPPVAFQRAGLQWKDLGQASQDAFLKIMQASLSAEGYNRVLAEWAADDANAAATGQSDLFGKQYYYVAIIGAPTDAGPWMYQFGGHHLAVNATVAGGRISVTPSFIGDQPASYTDAGGKTVRPLGDIEDEAFALVNSFDDTQKKAAVLGDTPINLVLGPGEDGKTIATEGLPLSQMNPQQQAAAVKLISHYTGLADDTDAAARLDEIKAGLAQTAFAWYGPTTAGQPAYFRFTGPTLVIEYAPQGGGGPGGGQGGPPSGGAPPSGAAPGGAGGGAGGGDAAAGAAISGATIDHIHGVYRDPTNEYGSKYAS
jgi:Protein of unknown function (DUF3500)